MKEASVSHPGNELFCGHCEKELILEAFTRRVGKVAVSVLACSSCHVALSAVPELQAEVLQVLTKVQTTLATVSANVFTSGENAKAFATKLERQIEQIYANVDYIAAQVGD